MIFGACPFYSLFDGGGGLIGVDVMDGVCDISKPSIILRLSYIFVDDTDVSGMSNKLLLL